MKAVYPIHCKVKGRGRYRITGLKHSRSTRAHLERRLGQRKDILGVSASTVTGNLLVSYNSDNTHHSVLAIIEEVLQEIARPGVPSGLHLRPGKPDRPSHMPPAGPAGKPSVLPRAEPTRDAIKEDANWHRLDRRRVMSLVGTGDETGLSADEAMARLQAEGPNLLSEAKARSGWRVFFDQFNSLPVYLLGAAAGVSVLTGGLLDAAIIMGVVAANAAIGYVTETEADKAICALKDLVHPRAEVIRDGSPLSVPAQEVVSGDILVLKPGSYVAADSRIVSAKHLSIDESMLTGESMPVTKHARVLKGASVALGDRANMAFMGTLVTGGQGLAVVVATGENTQIGAIQAMLQDAQAPVTPIERQLGIMGDQLVLMCCGVCGLVFLMGFFRGYGFLQMLRMAISLAAAAVPEGLPAAATINFAMGITRMRRHRVLIRHLQAVETLGAVQTICLDKTGTITRNRMAAQKIYTGERRLEMRGDIFLDGGIPLSPLEDQALGQLLAVCALCHEIKINGVDAAGNIQLFGSATETALVRLAVDAQMDVRQM
jgi:P-type Ca2+ transporter type 2C